MVKFYVQRPSPGPIVAVMKKVLGRSPCGAEARKRERRTDGFAHENAPQWVPASNERCGFPRGPGQNDPEMVAHIEIFFNGGASQISPWRHSPRACCPSDTPSPSLLAALRLSMLLARRRRKRQYRRRGARRRRRCEVDVRNLVNGVMYVPRTGCRWRYIPTTDSNRCRNRHKTLEYRGQ
jgi:hypothetical protein